MVRKRRGYVEERQLYSSFLQEEAFLMIYLPDNYSPLYSYPTLYVQDGADYFSLGKLASQLDQLITQNLVERCIVVAVLVPNKKERLVRYRHKGSKHKAYTRFFAEELVSFIDNQYSTLPISGARAVMGESLGGAVSLDIALEYPHTFHYVVSQSGAFYDGFEERLRQYTHSPELLSIYQSIGTEETEVSTSSGSLNLLEINRSIKRLFEEKGVSLHYREFNGYHTWRYWQEDLVHALSYLWRT